MTKNIAIVVTKEEDLYYRWDGDGPDPANDGLVAYNVIVTVYAIRKGKLYSGDSVLGGVYLRPDELPADSDIHGYYSDMLEETLANLREAMAV